MRNDSPVTPASITGVRIDRVEAIPLRMPMKSPIKFSGGSRPFIDTLLVRLHTADGASGVGETQAWLRQGSSETHASLCAVVRDHFAPQLIGRSPFDIASIMQRLEDCVYHSLYAQAAVSDALFDLQGKLLGLPVHVLLGGRCRDQLAACVVLFMFPTVDQTVQSAKDYQARGFNSFTIKVGLDLKQDLQTIAALREQLGADAVIRVDANAGMDFDSALWLLERAAPYHLDAAEQLLPIWDVAGLAELARRSTTPLMVDESLSDVHDLMAIVRQRAATVIHTKIGKNGGLWGCRKLWQIAAAAGMRIYPGNHPSTSIATLAAVQQAAAWPGPLLEGAFAVGIEALAEDVVTQPVQMHGNCVMVPDLPGLGVELDEAKLREFRVPI